LFFSSERTGEDICKKFIEKIENNPNIEIFLETDVIKLISEKVALKNSRKEFI